MNNTLEQHCSKLESHLKDMISNQGSILFELLAHHFGWNNQRSVEETDSPIPHFESLLCMHLSDVLGNDPEQSLHLAGAIELVANFIEIHNDVQNGGQASKSDSIWWSWGPAQAINAGDGLHALARTSILNHPDLTSDNILLAVKNLDRACLSLFEGQFSDINFRDQMEITEPDFINMLSGKAGSLSSCASYLATIPSKLGLTPATQASYGQIGHDLGVAIQIRRDLRSIWGHDNTGITRDNLMLRRKTLPLIYTLNNSDEPTKRAILTAYMSRVMDDDAGMHLIDLMTESGGKTYAESTAEKLYKSSVDQLKALNDQITPQHLDTLSELYEDFCHK